MIHILKKYYTKAGRIVIPLSFTGVAYDCQYSNGNKVLLKASELFEENPRKKVKVEKPTIEPTIEVVPEFIFESDKPKETLDVDDLINEINEVSESTEKETVEETHEKAEKPVDKNPKKQDNIKETADDFYADFM